LQSTATFFPIATNSCANAAAFLKSLALTASSKALPVSSNL
jgi:hypothetical protein